MYKIVYYRTMEGTALFTKLDLAWHNAIQVKRGAMIEITDRKAKGTGNIGVIRKRNITTNRQRKNNNIVKKDVKNIQYAEKARKK